MYNLRQIVIKDFLSIEDVTYVFNQNEPYVIVGQNLDNRGQKGNGSGKSSFIEAIAFAITGLTLRDVSIKKLVRRGQKQGSVVLELFSDKGNELIIERIIDTKASKQTSILFNGKEEHKTLPDENSRNAWIMNEIGVSKEDFFQDYLVTRNRYKPFFLQSDNEKKTTINRFSGADIVDKIYPFIDIDSKTKENEINTYKQQLAVGEGVLETFLTQRDDLQNRTSDFYLPQIERLQNRNIVVNEFIETSEANIISHENEILDIRKQLDVLKDNNYNELIELSEKEKESLIQSKNTLWNKTKPIDDQYNLDIEDNNKNIRTIGKDIGKISLQIKETKAIISDTENKIQASVECPKCHHNFVIDDDFDVDEGKIIIADCNIILIDLNKQADDLQLQLNVLEENEIQLREKRKKDLTDIENELNKINDEIRKKDKNISLLNQQLNANKLKINRLENDIKSNEDSIESFEKSIEKYQFEIKTNDDEIIVFQNKQIDQNSIDELQLKIDKKIEDNQNLRELISLLEIEKQGIDEWYTNFKNFKSSLANQSIDNIQQYTNLYLQKMNSDLTIKLEGYKEQGKKLKEQINVIIQRDGFDIGEYGEFSGGEQGRVDFANILAKQTLINLNSHNGLNFIFIDEVMETLDSTGIEMIIQSLKSIGKPLMVVSQQEINSLSKNTITMVKKNGITSLK